VIECDAIHEVPGVASRFFGIRHGKQLRAFMADAWTWHRSTPASYQTIC
jgi:hypothetical protein